MRNWILLSIPLGLILSFSGSDGRVVRKADTTDLGQVVARVDLTLQHTWEREGISPASPIDDLTFARRLWLDLLGTLPSLQEIREIEARPEEGRRAWMIDKALNDPRFEAVFAERLARISVGAGESDDLTYRRRRLVVWLTAQVRKNRPWDELVRDLITAEGHTTGQPATNYIVSQKNDPIKLAARTTRAFLAVRIDCAQCHDHPFARWTQSDFESLAAYFARTDRDLAGVSDKEEGELQIDRPLVKEPGELSASNGGESLDHPMRTIQPAVPYSPELLPTDAKTRRQALAVWLTHDENPFFAKAIVNRLWYWLIGRGIVEPLDELDSTKPRSRELLNLLAEDLVSHGYDLKRTIRSIINSKAYSIDSRVAEGVDEEAAEDAWAAYPLKPLRGDQLGAAILQSTSFWTYDDTRAPLVRFIKFNQNNEFTERHGDDLALEEPLEETLLQRLHLLNGNLITERTKGEEGFSPTTRVPALSPTDEQAIDNAFLMVLTRRPLPEERAHYVAKLASCKDEEGENDKEARAEVMADLFWQLMNTTEFAWGH